MHTLRVKTLGTDLLFYHIKYEQVEEILSMLQRNEVDVNHQDVNGATGLHVAANIGSDSLTRILLTHNANPNVHTHMDVGYNTPLHLAAHKGALQVCQLLLGAGAEVNERNKLGQTPLHVAVRQLDAPLARHLLRGGTDPNIRDVVGCTPSFYARQNEMFELLNELPAPVCMQPEEVMEHHHFVRAVLGIKAGKKAAKKTKKGKTAKK